MLRTYARPTKHRRALQRDTVVWLGSQACLHAFAHRIVSVDRRSVMDIVAVMHGLVVADAVVDVAAVGVLLSVYAALVSIAALW
jgi:hypothetical protein